MVGINLDKGGASEEDRYSPPRRLIYALKKFCQLPQRAKETEAEGG